MTFLDKNGVSEEEFLASYDSEKYPRPSVTTDVVLLRVGSSNPDNYRMLPKLSLEVLLVRRGGHPYLGKWALPGGFVEPGEPLDQAALRELKEETGAEEGIYLEQLYTLSDPGRDPRGWIISASYLALACSDKMYIKAGDDASEAAWFKVSLTCASKKVCKLKLVAHDEVLRATLAHDGNVALPPLASKSDVAFDHAQIIAYAIRRLRNKVEYTSSAFHLLPEKFTLAQLQQVHELVLGHKLLTPAFRRKAANWVTVTDEFSEHAGHRPAQLYTKRRQGASCGR